MGQHGDGETNDGSLRELKRRGILAVGFAALATVFGRTASSASAADGQPLLLGQQNNSTSLTLLMSTATNSALDVSNDSGNGITGRSTIATASGLLGVSVSEAVGAVHGVNQSNTLTGVRAGVSGWSGGMGTGNGTGIWGLSGSGNGVVGASTSGFGVRGDSSSGIGVQGTSSSNVGTVGTSNSEDGVRGTSFSGNGVFGLSTNGGGVIGQSAADNSSGIGGINTGAGPGASGVSVGTGDGVHGISNSANGVLGTSGTGTGVHGVSSGGQAGQFDGSVVVNGDFTVTGAKSAAVVLPDGSHRRLYCLESPESYFEDIGSAILVDGSLTVQLDPDFAAVTRTDEYEVFLQEYGESQGLYVSEQGPMAFSVRERNNGRSRIRFGYRILAKRKDILGRRFEKIDIPKPAMTTDVKVPRRKEEGP